MTWVRVDDDFTEHPKVVGLSAPAFRLLMEGLCYSSRNLTDGKIPAGALQAMHGSLRNAVELVEAGLWEEGASGWAIHDYLEYNPSRADVDGKRQHISEERSKAGSKGAASRWQSDGPVPDPVPQGSSNQQVDRSTPPPKAKGRPPPGGVDMAYLRGGKLDVISTCEKHLGKCEWRWLPALQKLKQEYGVEELTDAFEEAGSNNARSIRYVETVAKERRKRGSQSAGAEAVQAGPTYATAKQARAQMRAGKDAGGGKGV